MDTSQSYVTSERIPQMYTSGGRTLYDMKEVQKVANAVCLITTPSGSGTGFLVGSNHVMTNAHVAKSVANCRLSIATFSVNEIAVEVKLDPDSLYITSPSPFEDKGIDAQHLDYAIVGTEASSKLRSIVPLDLRMWERTHPVDAVIVQHPNGGPKKISLSGNAITRITDLIVQYKTETEYGSSGSPVLCGIEGRLQVFALHHCRVPESNANEGIKIDSIMRDLEAKGQLGTFRSWIPSAVVKRINWTKSDLEPRILTEGGPYDAIVELEDGLLACGKWKQDVVEIVDRSGDCEAILGGYGGAVVKLPNGQIATGSSEGIIKIWDSKGSYKRAVKAHDNNGFLQLLLLQDRRLVSVNRLPTVKIWDLELRRCERSFEAEGSVVPILELSSGTLAIGSNRNNIGWVEIWKVEEICLRKEKTPGIGVGLLAKVDDNLFASAGSGGYVAIWTHSGEKVRQWYAHERNVGQLMLMPGSRLGTASYEGIKIWTIEGECLISHTQPVQWNLSRYLYRFGEPLESYLPIIKGGLLDQGGLTLKMMDLSTYQFLAVNTGNSRINAVARLKDGSLVVAGQDGSLKIWDSE